MDTVEQSRPFRMGFTPWPHDATEEAAASAYSFIASHGDLVCHHLDSGVPWSQAASDDPFPATVTTEWRSRLANTPHGSSVYLALTPLNFARDGLADSVGNDGNSEHGVLWQSLPLSDSAIKRAYLRYCREAIQWFNPSYVAIGIEVNLFAKLQPARWNEYVELHRATYDALKIEYPRLPIFASVAMHDLLATDRSAVAEERSWVAEFFTSRNDIFAFSFYPDFVTTDTGAVAARSALSLARELAAGLPIAVAETGSNGASTRIDSLGVALSGSPDEQRLYLVDLIQAAFSDRFEFVVWFLHRDYDAYFERFRSTWPELFKAWVHMGLLDAEGNARSALEVWDRTMQIPYKRM